MALLLLKQKASKQVIQKRDRVSLIVNYSMDSYLAFFKDKTFLHLTRQKESLKQGKLQFVPTQLLNSNVHGRIVLLGMNEQNRHLCTCIEVDKDYQMTTRQISNIKPSLSTKHHLLQSPDNQTFYLIRIAKNIQNGISIQVYDILRDQWSDQILYLNSKFLLYQLLNTHLCNKLYNQASDIDCNTFALISQGDKFDSINYSKVKIYHQKVDNSVVLKTKFIITREPKLKSQQFVFLGSKQVSHNKIVLVGNFKKVINANQYTHSAGFIILNTQMIQNDNPQQVMVNQTSFLLKNNTTVPLFIRSFIGVVDDNAIVLAKITGKSWGVAKINENSHQLLLEFDKQKPPKVQISSTYDSFYCYETLHQYFFQKIKQSPTIIDFNLFKIQRKTLQYQRIIKYAFPNLPEHFSDMILHLL